MRRKSANVSPLLYSCALLLTGVTHATADARAAGAAAHPILLVPSSGVAPAEVKAALDALKPLGVWVLGGPGAVADATLASLGL